MSDERRKFERVNIPASAKIRVESTSGKPIGTIRMLGRGGLMVETHDSFELGKKMELVIVDSAEGIHRRLAVLPRYRQGEGVGFEFHHLDADAAVEIGVMIGRYYAHPEKK